MACLAKYFLWSNNIVVLDELIELGSMSCLLVLDFLTGSSTMFLLILDYPALYGAGVQ